MTSSWHIREIEKGISYEMQLSHLRSCEQRVSDAAPPRRSLATRADSCAKRKETKGVVSTETIVLPRSTRSDQEGCHVVKRKETRPWNLYSAVRFREIIPCGLAVAIEIAIATRRALEIGK